MAMPLTIVRDKDSMALVSGPLAIPCVKWGMKDPSNFVLRVGDTVDLKVQVTVRISP